MEVFESETLEGRIKEFNEPMNKIDLNKAKRSAEESVKSILGDSSGARGGQVRVPLTLPEINQIAFEQATTATIKKEWMEYYKYMKKTAPEEYIKIMTPPAVVMMNIKEEMKIKHKYYLDSSQIYGYWIVVSPKTDTADFKLLLEFGLKLLNKKNLVETESYFSIEQRGTTVEDMGYGPHINVLVRKLETQYYEPTRFEKMVRRHFRRVQEDVNNIRFIWFKAVTQEKYMGKIRYIKGEKKSEKLESVKIDKIWREEFKIKDWYHFV